RLWAKILEFKDKRVKAITEIVNSIKVLKLYAWEGSFMDQVLKLRLQETNTLSSIMKLGTIQIAIIVATPFLVSLVSFTAFILISNNNILDANKAFVSLLLFNIMSK
ncbi:unnamed protein product, partial [Oppiella nova]